MYKYFVVVASNTKKIIRTFNIVLLKIPNKITFLPGLYTDYG